MAKPSKLRPFDSEK